jgi:hypothetical protein
MCSLTDKIRLFVRALQNQIVAVFASPRLHLVPYPHPRRVDLIGQSDSYNTIPWNGPYSNVPKQKETPPGHNFKVKVKTLSSKSSTHF